MRLAPPSLPFLFPSPSHLPPFSLTWSLQQLSRHSCQRLLLPLPALHCRSAAPSCLRLALPAPKHYLAERLAVEEGLGGGTILEGARTRREGG